MRTSRRTLLRSAGVGLSLPVLESFGAAPAKASPKRMIAINQDLGFIPKRFFPETSGKDYALSPYLEKIAAHRNQFTVFSGLSRLQSEADRNRGLVRTPVRNDLLLQDWLIQWSELNR